MTLLQTSVKGKPERQPEDEAELRSLHVDAPGLRPCGAKGGGGRGRWWGARRGVAVGGPSALPAAAPAVPRPVLRSLPPPPSQEAVPRSQH